MILKPDLIPELSDVLELSVPESAVVAGGAFDPRINALFDAIVAICRQLCRIGRRSCTDICSRCLRRFFRG